MSDKGGLNRAFTAAALVTQVVVVVGIGAVLGSLADKRLGTAPWLFLFGTFGGFGLGIFRLFQALQRLDALSDDLPPHDSP